MLKRFSCLLLAAAMVFGLFAMAPIAVNAASAMVVSDKCVELIKQMEGFTAIPKWDYGQWTVGFGTRCPDEHLERYLAEGIPVDEAEALLAEKLVYFDEEVNKLIVKYGLMLNQGQYDALFSFTYNCGPAWMYKETNTLLNAVISGTRGNEFIGVISAWCTAGGEFLSGLMRRRLVEADMYLNGNYALYAPSNYCYVLYSYEGATCAAMAQGYDSRMLAWPMHTPVKEGYTFTGWYTAAEGGTRVEVLDASTHGMTLYAHWEEKSSANDGSEEDSITPVTVTVTGDIVNVRKGPGTGYDLVTQVTQGTELIITHVRDVDGTLWGKYSAGWICLTYTNYEEVIRGEVEPSEPAPDEDEEEEDENTLPPVPIDATIIGTDSVTVYNGPHTSYPKNATLSRGTKVTLLEIMDFLGQRWGRYEGGWICLNGNVMLHDDTVLINTFEVTVTNSYLNVRSGPGTNYSFVTTLKKNDVVEILALQQVGDTTWGRFEKGWICLTYTNFDPSMIPDQTPPSEEENPGEGCEHNYESVVTAPTCEEAGFTTHTCTVCGHSYVDTEVPASGHSYESIVTDPTCEEAGFTTHTCTNCGHSYIDSEVPASGHSYESVVTDPTCEEAGFATHTCTVCGHSYVDSEVDAIGHDYESVVTPPTATEKGYTTHTCKNCGHSYVDSYTDPLPVTVTRTYATVTYSFLNIRSGPGTNYTRVGSYSYGDRMEILEQQNVGSNVWGRTDKGWICLTGYTKLETVTEEVPNPGVITRTYATVTYSFLNIRSGPGTNYTLVGSYSYGDRMEILEQQTVGGNVWGRTDKGWICLTSYTKLEVVEEVVEHTHSYTSVVTAPTCEEGGYTTHTCTECGHSYVDSEVPALGHAYESVVTPPTATEKGYTTHTCKNCGHSYVDSYTDPLPVTVTRTYATVTYSFLNIRSGPGTNYTRVGSYSYGDRMEILEQQTVGGNVWGRTDKGWICLTGYTKLEVVEEAVEHTHSYTSVVTAPTCEEGGYTTHTCTECGHSYVDSEVPALGHAYESVVTPPTATEKGYTTHTCKRCGHSYVDSYTDPVPETVTHVYATITASALNIRSGPGTGYGWIGSYGRGTRVEILEQQTVGSNVWGRTDKGWICLTGYAKLETVTEEAPEKLIMTVTASALNIRSGPGTGYSWVGSYSYGTQVEVLEQKTVGSVTWARTDKGWVSMQYLK